MYTYIQRHCNRPQITNYLFFSAIQIFLAVCQGIPAVNPSLSQVYSILHCFSLYKVHNFILSQILNNICSYKNNLKWHLVCRTVEKKKRILIVPDERQNTNNCQILSSKTTKTYQKGKNTKLYIFSLKVDNKLKYSTYIIVNPQLQKRRSQMYIYMQD